MNRALDNMRANLNSTKAKLLDHQKSCSKCWSNPRTCFIGSYLIHMVEDIQLGLGQQLDKDKGETTRGNSQAET